jgi:hypothetical protein
VIASIRHLPALEMLSLCGLAVKVGCNFRWRLLMVYLQDELFSAVNLHCPRLRRLQVCFPYLFILAPDLPFIFRIFSYLVCFCSWKARVVSAPPLWKPCDIRAPVCISRCPPTTRDW